ncbi:MAG TPA: hypothetical protein DCW73_05070 [Treponema sp.]|nr:hypothetical protein [Treponema sp.]
MAVFSTKCRLRAMLFLWLVYCVYAETDTSTIHIKKYFKLRFQFFNATRETLARFIGFRLRCRRWAKTFFPTPFFELLI